jgi:hypothetical protein
VSCRFPPIAAATPLAAEQRVAVSAKLADAHDEVLRLAEEQLQVGKRMGGDGGFHAGRRRKAGGHGAIVHVDWSMKIENPSYMGDLTFRHAYRDNSSALLECLAVDVRFVLSQSATEHALPQAGLTQADTILVKQADIVCMESTRLECIHRSLGMGGGVIRGDNGLITHGFLLE